MFDSSEFADEPQALKSDVSRLLSTTAEGIFVSSENRADALADQIKAALNDLGEAEARSLQSQVSGAIHHPLNGILPLLVVPLITIIIKSLKKPAAKPTATASTAEPI